MKDEKQDNLTPVVLRNIPNENGSEEEKERGRCGETVCDGCVGGGVCVLGEVFIALGRRVCVKSRSRVGGWGGGERRRLGRRVERLCIRIIS